MKAKWILHITYGDPLSLKPTQKAIGYFDSEEHALDVASELYIDTNYIVEALPVTDLNIGEIESQKQGEK